MVDSQAKMRSLTTHFHSFDPALYVNADHTRLKQVMLNLLSNGIKYNRPNGTVEVICTTSAPDRIRISIKDTGIGLTPEKLSQLFQPFNRLGQESGTEEGTGIGLMVTKQLVELMGGKIGVESTVGVGSEFWIELIRDGAPHLVCQIENERTAPPKLAQQFLAEGKERTLLYVEDNPANLMLVQQIIEHQQQIRMLTARDGSLGIALARNELPDVILMDINLPGISGREALDVLRDDPRTAHIPIIALSANAMPHDIAAGMHAGFFHYLTKPIKVDEFMSALDEALKFSEGNIEQASQEQH